MNPPEATLDIERSLQPPGHTGSFIVAGMDEVGRGALAGPVTVGVAAVDLTEVSLLQGLRDSKKLTPKARETTASRISEWAWTGIGHAQPAEIDEYGISVALGIAGLRAWQHLLEAVPTVPSALILDGNYNWLAHPPEKLELARIPDQTRLDIRIKADATCATVSAAAIIAKVTRDKLMSQLDAEYQVYGWAKNKGYGSAQHRQALQKYGVSDHHRKSWKVLPEKPLQEPLLDMS